MQLKAKWIWKKRDDYKEYNQTIIARKDFQIKGEIKKASLIITADSYYRLLINNRWINDGPCRSWDDHYRYDVIDVTSDLNTGENRITVIARYFGVGTFHQLPKHPGLLLQLNITMKNGKRTAVCSDSSWKVSDAKGWISNTPKISIQMEPEEWHDARLSDKHKFSNAAEVFDVEGGPWKRLEPRDCPLLTRKPFSFTSFIGANIVKKQGKAFVFPVCRMCHPGIIEANCNTCKASAVAGEIVSPKAQKIRIESTGFILHINGKKGEKGIYPLRKGSNILVGVVPPEDYMGHSKEAEIAFPDDTDFALRNPLKGNPKNPWCFIPIEESSYREDDLVFPWFHNISSRDKILRSAKKKMKTLVYGITDVNSFRKIAGKKAKLLPPEKMLLKSAHWHFLNRKRVGSAKKFVINPSALMYDTNETTIITPSRKGDIELVYDLGEQNIGYYDFEINADKGVILDIFGVEYISENGKIQHTHGNRNGMRYICKQGVNRFTSLKRRSGRYLFVTLRNQTKPVSIREIQLIESTYPVNQIGEFSCSNVLLSKIWEISVRTLKLCMEDSYTDCPLYEQTLWVGDARNESLYGYDVFGATELGKRCITLAGESLGRYPLVGSQVPSSWDCILPAWSFLWGISVWDYYFFTGNKAFIKKTWFLIKKNLKGAFERLDKRGLFSAPFWNMFDWTNMDDRHKTVVHNSMLLVGAINAALKLADASGDTKAKAWLKNFRMRLISAINKLWDSRKKAYPDSIHEDGTISPSSSQHTSFLAVLYDIIEQQNVKAALKNIMKPPKNMIKVGSPFAMHYLYEALLKLGKQDHIINLIKKHYSPMIRKGATTVWETFFPLDFLPGRFPTRSHCHGWSCAPLYFFSRIILGIRQVKPGGTQYEISPRITDLKWAKGAVATVNGRIEVDWSIQGKSLKIKVFAPQKTKIRFVKNDTHKGLTVSCRIKRN